MWSLLNFNQSLLEKAIYRSLLIIDQSLLNINCYFVKDRVRYQVKATYVIINAYHATPSVYLDFCQSVWEKDAIWKHVHTVMGWGSLLDTPSKLQPFLILTDESWSTQRAWHGNALTMMHAAFTRHLTRSFTKQQSTFIKLRSTFSKHWSIFAKQILWNMDWCLANIDQCLVKIDGLPFLVEIDHV